MAEVVRVSRHSWPEVFGRAWKPALLIGVGEFHPDTALCGLGETGPA
ncbi:MAG: hypothetical protein GYA17_16345 [Chloroflexi bacterium]|nr:hypothetical protein [Chloroflexota bacterium]